MFENYRIIHFIGIGGIGMSGIAELLHNLGYEVTGSDIRESQNTKRLESLGVKVYIGHRAENVDSAHVVVVSSAIDEDNPEIAEARKRGIPIIPRAEMLAELGRLKYSILVAGAHGKTTTTSLVASVFSQAGRDPTVVIGGRLKATGSNVRLGQGEFLIAEADESDGSFLKLTPTVAVATNIDREHMDYFRTMDALYAAFRQFLDKVPFYGFSVLCTDNIYLRSIKEELNRRVISCGFSEDADVMAYDVNHRDYGMKFNVLYKGDELGEFFVPLVGRHNVLNALFAITVSKEMFIDTGTIKDSLKGFSGIQRRFEFKGQYRGCRVYDDYGHHPTEIKATLGAISGMVKGRTIVVFQPHRYTRTRDLFREFVNAFDGAHRLYLLDIYPAGERPIEGINSEALYEEIKKRNSDVVYMSDRAELLAELKQTLQKDDLLITLGAGDVWKIGEELLSSERNDSTGES